MPTSLASARGDSRLALVRDVPDAAHRSAVPPRLPPSDRTAAQRGDRRGAGETSPFSTTRRAHDPSRRVVGAVALVAALGTVLLAALAASATLAWAGG